MNWTNAAVFTPDGRSVVSVGYDKLLRITPAEAGGAERAFDFGAASLSLALTPDGKHAVVGCVDRTIRVVEIAKVPAAPAPLALMPPLVPPPPALLAPTGPTIPRVSPTTRFPVFHPDDRHLLTPDGNDVTGWDIFTRER